LWGEGEGDDALKGEMWRGGRLCIKDVMAGDSGGDNSSTSEEGVWGELGEDGGESSKSFLFSSDGGEGEEGGEGERLPSSALSTALGESWCSSGDVIEVGSSTSCTSWGGSGEEEGGSGEEEGGSGEEGEADLLMSGESTIGGYTGVGGEGGRSVGITGGGDGVEEAGGDPDSSSLLMAGLL
jgi:hypothetical protein